MLFIYKVDPLKPVKPLACHIDFSRPIPSMTSIVHHYRTKNTGPKSSLPVAILYTLLAFSSTSHILQQSKYLGLLQS